MFVFERQFGPRAAATLLMALMLCGCSAVDSSYSPRTNEVTADIGRQRDTNTFLNIVRSSRFDTLNFTALAKYTAGGSLQLTTNVFTRGFAAGAVLPADSFGPISPQGSLSNSFDLGSLENSEFYDGILKPIDPSVIDLLLRSGLTRNLVLLAIIDSLKIKLKNGEELTLVNDPTNDASPRSEGNRPSAACSEIKHKQPFRSKLWNDYNSCQYQKFLVFFHEALRFGVSTKSVQAPNPATSTDKNAPKVITKFVMCFDPSLANHNDGGEKIARGLSPNCDDTFVMGDRKLGSPASELVKTYEPRFRSTYGVFRYLGSLLRGDPALIPSLADPNTATGQEYKAALILRYTSDGSGCFVEAEEYCIPETSSHSKELISLLNTLVALSIKQTALPVTPTVQLTPGIR